LLSELLVIGVGRSWGKGGAEAYWSVFDKLPVAYTLHCSCA